ncbi:MAG: ketopantoate reductase family protein [Cyclobacteriaceae bacterium]
MKICFYGVGGVGGYFGALVGNHFKDEHEIYFVARGSHKEAICAEGLILKKDGVETEINFSPDLCTDNPASLPICDIIVLSVKAYDLPNAAREIANIAHDKTIILPLLNGVDIYERIREQLKIGIVLPSCVYVGTHIERPGVIYQRGGSCKIFMGNDPAHPALYPEALVKILDASEIDFSWEKDVNISIWSKYIFIAAFGLVTATFEKTLGQVLDSPELSRLTKAIMQEVEALARRTEISLSTDIVDASFNKAHQFPPETKTSFQRDVESKGKVNEMDLFGGTIIRLSDQYDIPVPQTRHVYDIFMNKFQS